MKHRDRVELVKGPGWRKPVMYAGNLCVLGLGGGGGTTSEFLPIALLLGGLTMAARWMFHRWGSNAGRTAEAPPEDRGAVGRLPTVEA